MEAETLPPEAYTSGVFYGREVEQIFMREWNFIGRADDKIKDRQTGEVLDFGGVSQAFQAAAAQQAAAGAALADTAFLPPRKRR